MASAIIAHDLHKRTSHEASMFVDDGLLLCNAEVVAVVVVDVDDIGKQIAL